MGLTLLLGERRRERAGMVSGRGAQGAFPFPHATFDVADGHWVRGVVRLGN